MKYSQAESEIKNGDVLTFAGDWLVSKLIRYWTKQEVSHVGLALWLRFGTETEDRLCVLESMEPIGTRIIPLKLALKSSSKVYWQKLKSEEPNEILGWAISQWGRKYASWAQFLSFISPTFRRTRKLLGYPTKVGTGFHCAEFVSEALNFGKCLALKESALMFPGDLWDYDCLDKPILLEL